MFLLDKDYYYYVLFFSCAYIQILFFDQASSQKFRKLKYNILYEILLGFHIFLK